MARKPGGGVGSNQYQTKPGGTARPRSDTDAEIVAAVFAGNLDRWRQGGLEDTEIVAWQQAGMEPLDTMRCLGIGITEPALGKTVIDMMPWEDLLRWEGAVPWEELAAWRQVTHTTPRTAGPVEARAWRTAGYTPEQAQPWLDAGFPTPADRDWWQQYNATHPRPRDPIDSTDPKRLGSIMSGTWSRYRIDPMASIQGGWATVYETRLHGGYDPAVVARWVDANVGDNYQVTPADAGDLIAQGVGLDWTEAAIRRQYTTTLYGQVPFVKRLHRDYRHLGGGDAATEFQRAWHGVTAASEWYGQGFTRPQAEKWAPAFSEQSGLVPAAETGAWWKRRGATPRSAAVYNPPAGNWMESRDRLPVAGVLHDRGADPEAINDLLGLRR